MHIWYPFQQHKTAPEALCVDRGKGLSLFDKDGKEYWDLISSWWVTVHGHSHPVLGRALTEQFSKLEHVIFAGITHTPAQQLCQQLCQHLPSHLSCFFFSDNGSTSVEVAIKMAHQYWYNIQTRARSVIMSFKGGYHGDTLAAMSAGTGSGFFGPFLNLMCRAELFDYPCIWQGKDMSLQQAQEDSILSDIDAFCREHADDVIAFVLEPLVQGAGGMRMMRAAFLDKLVGVLRSWGVLVIFDEVMTGFGRTGEMFAMDHIQNLPDMVCLSKGLTGGTLPLALTVTSKKIYDAFLCDSFDKAFAHGHSYTANPLGCAVALASLQLFKDEQTLQRIRNIQASHHRALLSLDVLQPRVCGSILAFEVVSPMQGYHASIGMKMRQEFMKRGLLIRPLGNTVYLMPPACISQHQLDIVYGEIADVIGAMR